MKVTVCQFNPAEDTLDQALDWLSEHLVKHGSDFLLLPEICFAPWLAADPLPNPQAWQDAVTMHEARIAGLRDLGVGAVVGTRPVIRENGSRRNQAYVWEAAHGSAAEAPAVQSAQGGRHACQSLGCSGYDDAESYART